MFVPKWRFTDATSFIWAKIFWLHKSVKSSNFPLVITLRSYGHNALVSETHANTYLRSMLVKMHRSFWKHSYFLFHRNIECSDKKKNKCNAHGRWRKCTNYSMQFSHDKEEKEKFEGWHFYRYKLLASQTSPLGDISQMKVDWPSPLRFVFFRRYLFRMMNAKKQRMKTKTTILIIKDFIP